MIVPNVNREDDLSLDRGVLRKIRRILRQTRLTCAPTIAKSKYFFIF